MLAVFKTFLDINIFGLALIEDFAGIDFRGRSKENILYFHWLSEVYIRRNE